MKYSSDEIFSSWIIAQMTLLCCVFCNTIPIVAKKSEESNVHAVMSPELFLPIGGAVSQ